MKDQELLELKSWAHQLFALECKRRNCNKDVLYKALAKTLGRNSHFSSMNEDQTREAISVLLRWLKIKPKSHEKKLKQSLMKQALRELKEANAKRNPQQIKEAIAKLPKREIPWYKKLYRLIRPHHISK